jgi:hypothetical protein
MANLSRPTFRPLALALALATASILASRGIDISATHTKYQGGVTNAPYAPPNAPSLFSNPFKWIFGSPSSSAMLRVQAPPNFKVDLSIEPQQYVPSSNTPLRVRMTVHNQGKNKYILDFDTAQRYEFVIRKDKQDVYKASQDKEFAQVKSSTVINRDEKLVYEEEIFAGEGRPPILLAPGNYVLVGWITSRQPVFAERAFQVAP